MHNYVLSPIDPEKLINDISEKVTANILKAVSISQPNETDRWFDLTELCNYHPDKPSKATVYGWVNAGLIPVHKGNKKLRFLKSEIDSWLKQGKRKTIQEAGSEADNYISGKKNKCEFDAAAESIVNNIFPQVQKNRR